MDRTRILYEDDDMIVCHKAAGIATQTARVGQADMVSEVTNYLASKARSGGEKSLYVGVVHRLDQPVEGVLVFARNQRAAAELSRQITENRMEKYYYAVVCGQEFVQSGRLTDYLLKDGKTNTSRIVPPEVKGAKKAVLDYEILAEKELSRPSDQREKTLLENDSSEQGTFGINLAFAADTRRLALVRIRLHTGRHHQIRVQMSHAGMSLLGDHKYADAQTVRISEQMHVKEIALCAYRLVLQHPGTRERMQFQIRPEGKSFQIEEFLSCYHEE